MDTERSGQAIIELAAGLLTAVLVFSAILFFSKTILESTGNAQEARCEAGSAAMGAHGLDEAYSTSGKRTSSAIESSTVRKAIGRDSIETDESVSIPAMGL